MPDYPRESDLEKFIKDVTYHNTAERVDLHLQDDIIISPINRQGSIVLGIFWSNVLQCNKNFPPLPYMYEKEYDKELDEEKLMLTVEDVTFTVYLRTGTLRLSGRYIYQWFTKNFRSILQNFDQQFGESWQFVRTPVVRTADDGADEIGDEDKTETEKYLLYHNTEHSFYPDIDRRLNKGKEDLVNGLGNLNIDHQLYSPHDLAAELSTLSQGGIRDGLATVYTIWKTLLDKWFSTSGTKVYLCSPMVDTERLQDIIDLYLKYQTKGEFTAFYTSLKADPVNGKSLADITKSAISKLDENSRTFIQYRLLRKIVHPMKPSNAVFIAGVSAGNAEVFVTSACFHGKYFVSGSSEWCCFKRMSEDNFVGNYLNILQVPNVATGY